MELKNKKIAFLGDSITQGVGVTGPEKLYWNLIAKETGAKCYGYGISGTRIALQRTPTTIHDPSFDRYFASRIEEMIPDADIVVVFGGTNDFGHGDAALGDMNDRTIDTFYGAYHDLLLKLMERYPNGQIVVMTPLHRDDENDMHYNNYGVRRASPLRVYVDAIREVAAYYGIPVADMYADCPINPNSPYLKERYARDGLHPNDAGHVLLAKTLLNKLKIL
ncbi:MAG: SGNH/GDSL hydrolase family protein [Oscillospiraceae bacterium]|nr:SGNH/GDSL hydrolase family protein [Oscillospiraceae bacterium]